MAIRSMLTWPSPMVLHTGTRQSIAMVSSSVLQVAENRRYGTAATAMRSPAPADR